jgi:Lon protease-like protein
MFTDGMKKVLLMIIPLLFWKPGNQVRSSTHIAGCEAGLIVIIDEVQRGTCCIKCSGEQCFKMQRWMGHRSRYLLIMGLSLNL